MAQFSAEGIGDNIEFTAVAIGDYTIFLSHPDNTSANDTEFNKYPNNQNGRDGSGRTARKFLIRVDKNTDLVELNGLEFTDPGQITADKPWKETRNVQRIFKLKLRTNDTNTMIKVRWF